MLVSSDDELSQLSTVDSSFQRYAHVPYEIESGNGLANAALGGIHRDIDAKQELYRELMLCENDLSSSPDFERFSPLFEEKYVAWLALVLLRKLIPCDRSSNRGLPVEVRYQLPLALGTANETDKECTICQVRYGIGDHIVTLPCQHFFQ